jgi:polar amino acid transport system substrate-binding protein
MCHHETGDALKMKLRWMIAAFAALTLLAAACGNGDDGATDDGAADNGDAAADLDLVSEGTLTVCTDAPYPPMEFEDPETGEFTGFDIELMRAIADQMGLETEVVNSGFDPIVSGTALASGQCDIAAASITITEEREENVDFTEPYFEAEQSLLVKQDSDISSLDDLEGEQIGVQSGTTGEMYANDNAPDGAEIRSYDDPGDIFLALEGGTIAGVVQDLVVNQGRTLEDDTVEVVETYETDEQYGFAAEEGNTELTSAVNDALSSLQEDGTYDSIYEEWFGSGDE